MNQNQKHLTIVAVIFFCLSVVCAPWELQMSVDSDFTAHIANVYSPIFLPPKSANVATSAKLRMDSLVMEWFAMGVIYGGLLVLLKKSKE